MEDSRTQGEAVAVLYKFAYLLGAGAGVKPTASSMTEIGEDIKGMFKVRRKKTALAPTKEFFFSGGDSFKE